MKEIKRTYEAACVLLIIFVTGLLYAFRWAKSINK